MSRTGVVLTAVTSSVQTFAHRRTCRFDRLGEASGIHRFRAYVLADNDRMLAMLSLLTDIQQRKIEQGVVDVVFTRRRIPG